MRRPRAYGLCLALLFCAAVALSALLPAWAWAAQDAGTQLTVGVPIDRCPVFYRDARTGEVTGIGVDLMESAAQSAGFTVSFKPVEEKTLKDALDSDAYDVIMPFGSAITSSSGKPTVVSDNLIQTPFTLVTADKREIPQLNELHVGMLSSLGGVAETVQQLYPQVVIDLYDSMPACVSALRAGEVDALLHNSYVWSYVLQKPSYADLTVQPSTMFSMDFRAGTLDTPQGRALIERLNQGIATLDDTRRQAIVLDHTSRRLYQYDLGDYLYQYGAVLFLGTSLFAALVIITLQKRRTLRLEQEEKMRQILFHDPLTGAYSLNGFRLRVEELLNAHPDVPYLLTYTNIKGFKYVNESLGREAGDELLRYWVQATQKVLSDEEAMGRVDGDHFAVLERNGGAERLEHTNSSVIDSVRNYFVGRGMEQPLHVCGGIYVLTPEDYQQINVDCMLDYARSAEKHVRATRDDGYEIYKPQQWETGRRMADIVDHLPKALSSGEVQVWYQPQVDYATGRIDGAEALCRWNHSKLGWICPGEFIPVLEQHGLIHQLDFSVWEQACKDLQRWNQQGKRRQLSVNVSRRDIRESQDVAAELARLVQRYELDFSQLRVEITESAYVEDHDLIIRTTARLRELGFQVEMDDFGSGYSSLNMLKQVTVDRIKLDLLFLASEGDPERGRIIVSHVIQMVESLGMELIAEGVETEEQARFLLSQGCSHMQGYYFHKPMPVQEFERVADESAADEGVARG